MIHQIYFKDLDQLHELCKAGGYEGDREDFLGLNMGEVFAYLKILIGNIQG